MNGLHELSINTPPTITAQSTYTELDFKDLDTGLFIDHYPAERQNFES
jgi:hypothetical protein